MRSQKPPTRDDILALVAELVPDVPRPSELFAEIRGKDRTLWLEGWCDGLQVLPSEMEHAGVWFQSIR